ncbi:MAG: cytochrome c biogenesis protein CcdC [Gemmatimonadetes bacterium]|nr:MAG: cytochrome c biogenesis protein CcdC [Gemmatimonadota bacterium]
MGARRRGRVAPRIGITSSNMQDLFRIAFRVAPVVGGAAIIAWRIQETRRPVTPVKILAPPLGMATGFGMFVVPAMRVPLSWALIALVAGALFLAVPLVRSSSLEDRDGVVMMRRSPGFLLILLGLLAVRLALEDVIGHVVSPLQTAALFYLAAFGMIVRWRVTMYLRYRALKADVRRWPTEAPMR